MDDLIGLIKSESIYEEDSVSELAASAQNHSDLDPLRLSCLFCKNTVVDFLLLNHSLVGKEFILMNLYIF